MCIISCEYESVSHLVMFDCETPWTVAQQAPLSMEFSRQEYWSGFSSPGDLADLGSNPSVSPCRRALYHLSHQGSPKTANNILNISPLIRLKVPAMSVTHRWVLLRGFWEENAGKENAVALQRIWRNISQTIVRGTNEMVAGVPRSTLFGKHSPLFPQPPSPVQINLLTVISPNNSNQTPLFQGHITYFMAHRWG